MRNTLQFASALTATALALATIAVVSTADAGLNGSAQHGNAAQAPLPSAAATWDRG
ncbi:MAG TPA: hypothetical protein VK862_02820 [Afifellaceae bacterium]|nr:hypothetical protein [Afifellaceae bacterium]